MSDYKRVTFEWTADPLIEVMVRCSEYGNVFITNEGSPEDTVFFDRDSVFDVINLLLHVTGYEQIDFSDWDCDE